MAKSSKTGLKDITSKGSDSLPENVSESEADDAIAKFTSIDGITAKIATALVHNGITTLEELVNTEKKQLGDMLGIDEDEAADMIESTVDILDGKQSDHGSGGRPEENERSSSDDALAQWLTGESEGDLDGLLGDEIQRAKEKGVEKKSREIEEDEADYDALKAWLTGEEDSFGDWLGEETFEEEKEVMKEELAEKEEILEESKKELDSKMSEISVLKEEFKSRLEEMESGDFDATQIVDENIELREEITALQENITSLEEEKQQLRDEMEEIKQGSVAMLKYLKAQKLQMAEGGGASSEEVQRLRQKNEDLKTRIKAMESSGDFEGMEDTEIIAELKKKESLLERKEKEIEKKNQSIQDLRDELNFKEEELDDLKEKMRFKEQELNDREEDLMHREEVMKKQRIEMESLRQEFGGSTEKERKRRLEELEKEISRKEQEIKAKEKYITQKERELRSREEDLIDEELEERQEEILMEIEQEKARTGTSRLDDLTMGGIPLGSNVSIYGPPHSGKRVLINSFIAEGLEKGVPAVWVVTDKTVKDVREEMKFVLPTFEEYEIRGLVYYVDAYSVSMGETIDEDDKTDYITYVEGQSDIEAITTAVEKFADEIMEKHRYYRLAFVSVSTLIAYLDTSTTFRSLQPFAGRRKRDKAVAMYTLEKGMHSQQDISMLGHMMDGEIEFKFQQLKTFLRVGGLGDVQTRDWVRYTSSKSGITMGSFSLDTIR